MATVKLFADELEEGGLPPVCMRCGAPADVFRPKRFSWGPGWVMALLIAGVLCSGPLFLVALILLPILLRTRRVVVPLCGRHRNHWLPLAVLLYGGLATLATLISLSVLLYWLTEGQSELAGWLCGGSALLFFCLLFPAAVLQVHTIRAVEITPETITLTGVAREFVRALDGGRPPDVAGAGEGPPPEAGDERITRPRRPWDSER
jgi:hypothetical protein